LPPAKGHPACWREEERGKRRIRERQANGPETRSVYRVTTERGSAGVSIHDGIALLKVVSRISGYQDYPARHRDYGERNADKQA
jgi:hypothetical protein